MYFKNPVLVGLVVIHRGLFEEETLTLREEHPVVIKLLENRSIATSKKTIFFFMATL
jgi:hypothetical protein